MVYEEKLLGTAGTLKKNRNFFGNESVMLIHADNLSLFDVGDFIQKYKERAPEISITMMIFSTSTPESCGIVELDERGVVQELYEKAHNPPGNLANGAVYILSPEVLNFIDSLGKETIDFSTEVLPKFLGRINTYHNNIYHRDIGTVESLKKAQKEFPPIYTGYQSKNIL